MSSTRAAYPAAAVRNFFFLRCVISATPAVVSFLCLSVPTAMPTAPGGLKEGLWTNSRILIRST